MSLSPILIPQQRAAPLHDLNTRVGRAYERLAAFLEKVAPKLHIEAVAMLATFGERELANKRLDDIADIVCALQEELRAAKEEDGQCVPPADEGLVMNLAEWDQKLLNN